jgi:hypothetical protein
VGRRQREEAEIRGAVAEASAERLHHREVGGAEDQQGRGEAFRHPAQLLPREEGHA